MRKTIGSFCYTAGANYRRRVAQNSSSRPQPSNSSHRRAITKLIFREDSYRLHADHDIPREERLCHKCLSHVESPQYGLLQCSAGALRRNLLELLQARYAIPVPNAPLSDEQATALLQSIIFHWEAISWAAQFIYRIHCIW